MHLTLRRIYREYLTIPLLLLITCVLSYGILTPWLGFLQDDWYIMWHVHVFGPSIFSTFFSWERPGLGSIYQTTTSLLGTSPLAWQVFAVFCRWLVTLVFWWLLRLVWPGRLRQVTWAALIFAVYPGFRSLHFAVLYSNLLLILAIHIFSFCAMILAVRQRRWFVPLTVLAVVGAVFSMFSAEYFFGWELLRPLFLWIVLGGDGRASVRTRLQSVFLHWLPYLAGAASFFVWRVFIFKFPTKYQPVLYGEILADPPAAILKIAGTIIQDILDTSLFAWERTFDLLKSTEILSTTSLLAMGLAVLSAGVVAVWLFLQQRKDVQSGLAAEPEQGDGFVRNALFVGLCSAVLAGWPFWFVGLEVNSEIGPDRFTLAFMMGVCILIAGLLEWLIKTQTQKIILVSILVGLASAQHFEDANTMRRVHEAQTKFFYQLVWRMPALTPNVMLVTDKFPLPYSSDTSLTAPLNWIYNQTSSKSMDYGLFELESRLGNVIPELKPGLPVQFGLRAATLYSGTSNMVVFNYSPPGCVHILSSAAEQPATLPKLIASAAQLSNPDFIVPNPAHPAQIPEGIFGPPPPLDWCYYYEKADLARQTGDWQKVYELGEAAFKQGHSPETPFELLPFIDGHIHTNRFEEARRLTVEAWEKDASLQPALCQIWQQAMQTGGFSEKQQAIYKEITNQIDCADR